MTRLLWSNELLTGLHEIDNQHRKLFSEITKFIEACEKGDGKKVLLDTLAFLEKYVRLHFVAEEQIQRVNGYPRLSEHQALHAALLTELLAFKDDVEKQGTTPELIKRAMHSWGEWFVRHIAQDDKEIADFLRQKREAEKVKV